MINSYYQLYQHCYSADQFYYIACGSKYDRYLDARTIAGSNILQGVTNKGSASVFSVEPKQTKGGPPTYKLLLQQKDSHLLVARSDKRKTGRGSIEVGGGRSIKFSLNNNEGGSGLTVEDWETMPCRINIAQQSKDGYAAGFLGYNEKQNMCEFISKADSESAGKIWLHCKLEKVEVATGEGAAKAPTDVLVKPPITVRACIDSSDEDEYTFGE
jgi:hypothetical protein